MTPPQEPNDLVTKSYVDSSLQSYLPLNAKAANSNLLNGLPGSYYSDIISRLGFTPENIANKGQVLGYAELDMNGLIPVNRLPQDVFNVKQYSAKTYFPTTGQSNVIYIDASTNFIYRWTGYDYVGVSGSSGSSEDALRLTYPRNINGTPFDGSSDIVTSFWGNTVNLTIGNTTRQINGSTDLSWSIEDILGFIPVNKAGDVITGPLLLAHTPTDPLEATNKDYVDYVLTNAVKVPTGGMIVYDDNADLPNGFLRCNGALVSKSQYQALYEVIGDKYSLSQVLGGGSFWNQQYGINTNTGQPGTVNKSSYTIDTNNSDSVCVGFNKNKVYVAYGTTIVYGTIDSNGNVSGGFSTGPAIPAPIGSIGYIYVSDTRIYIYGCYSGSNNGVYTYNSTYTATINPDGSINTFTAATTLNLPSNYVPLVTSNSIYLVGENTSLMSPLDSYSNPTTFGSVPGITDTISLKYASGCCSGTYAYIAGVVVSNSNKIYVAPINSGLIGSWVSYDIPFSVNYTTSCTILNGYIYVNNYLSVYRGTLNTDGSVSNWTSVVPSPISYSISSRTVYSGGSPYTTYTPTKQYMYSVNNNIILTSQNYYYTTVNTDLTVPAFRGFPYVPNLNYDPSQSVCFVTKNKIYMVCNYINTNTVLCSDIDSSGNAGGFYDSGVIGLGTNSITQSKAVIYNNTVYILGGNTLNVYSASINSDGSIGNFSIVGTAPNSITYGVPIIIGNLLYYVGGRNSSNNYVNSVYYCVINTNGTLSPWVNINNLPSPVSPGALVFTGKYLYILGGSSTSTVYSATVNSDNTIGIWNLYSNIPISIYNCGVLVTTSNVYMFYNGNYYIAPINLDGTLGTWSGSVNLGFNVTTQPVCTSSKIYLFSRLSQTNVYTYYYPKTYYINYIGGLNDYSYYYDPNYQQSQQQNTFRLPIAYSSMGGYIIRY